MELHETVRAVFKELIVPELEIIKGDLREIKKIQMVPFGAGVRPDWVAQTKCCKARGGVP